MHWHMHGYIYIYVRVICIWPAPCITIAIYKICMCMHIYAMFFTSTYAYMKKILTFCYICTTVASTHPTAANEGIELSRRRRPSSSVIGTAPPSQLHGLQLFQAHAQLTSHDQSNQTRTFARTRPAVAENSNGWRGDVHAQPTNRACAVGEF